MEDNKFEPRTIRIVGDGEIRDAEIERYRDFMCYGAKNVEEVCGACVLRFQCLSTREDVEIPVKAFGKKSIRDVTARMVANKISSLKYSFKQQVSKSRVQIDYSNVERKQQKMKEGETDNDM